MDNDDTRRARMTVIGFMEYAFMEYVFGGGIFLVVERPLGRAGHSSAKQALGSGLHERNRMDKTFFHAFFTQGVWLQGDWQAALQPLPRMAFEHKL